MKGFHPEDTKHLWPSTTKDVNIRLTLNSWRVLLDFH